MVRAQVFQFNIGSSSLFQATGGSVRILAPGSEVSAGAGVLNNSFTTGGLYRRPWKALTFTLGDEMISIRLPTDLFDSNHYFFGRGGSATIERERTRICVFVGATSNGVSSPFFQGGSTIHGAGAVFFDRKISRKLKFISRTIFSTRQTNLEGVEWQPTGIFKTNFSGGIGANSGYFGGGLSIETRPISLRAGYVAAASDFQRLLVPVPVNSENTGANVLLTVRPYRYLDFTAAHFNLIEPDSGTKRVLRASMNQYSTVFRCEGVNLAASLFRSATEGLATFGTSFTASRNLTSRAQMSAELFHSRLEHASSVTSFVGIVREIVSSRLSLNQVVNHMNGNTTVSWGGDFLSNLLSVGIDYQTVYSPLFPKAPFRQVVLLHLHLQLTHFLQASASTYVGADGSVKYTTYGGVSGFHNPADSDLPAHFKFPRYIVRGKVVDDRGEPVNGAALRIGRDLLFTDTEGQFYVREKTRTPIEIRVLLSEFLTAGRFNISLCPATVIPALAESASMVTVVLNRSSN